MTVSETTQQLLQTAKVPVQVFLFKSPAELAIRIMVCTMIIKICDFAKSY